MIALEKVQRVYWNEMSISHVTLGSKVQIEARSQVSWLLVPSSFQILHNPHTKRYHNKWILLTNISHFHELNFSIKSHLHRLTNASVFLFSLFLHTMSVGVHLSEWNTEEKLGHYSLQLQHKLLSFKSPPHPHFPSVCHWKPSPQMLQQL